MYVKNISYNLSKKIKRFHDIIDVRGDSDDKESNSFRTQQDKGNCNSR